MLGNYTFLPICSRIRCSLSYWNPLATPFALIFSNFYQLQIFCKYILQPIPQKLSEGQESSHFCIAFGHPVSFFSWASEFVVSVAVAIPLISLPRERNKVLNEQHWHFEKQFLIMGVRWLSYWGSQLLPSLETSLSNDFALHQLDRGERFPWVGEGTTKLFQNSMSNLSYGKSFLLFLQHLLVFFERYC